MKRFVLFCLVLPALVASQSLLLIGGGLSDGNVAVWNKMIELAGGKGVARIGLFTTASEDPVGSVDYYTNMFVNVYGAASVTYIPVTETSNNADDMTLVDMVGQQTGIFFGGGDQLRITHALRPNGTDSKVLTAVKNLLKSGAVVGGTSAGTACQTGGVMFTGGVSWNALAYGSFPGVGVSSNDLTYEPLGGLGFLEGWLIDTHFSERGREGRLIRLLQDTRSLNIGTTKGLGVDEDTALAITDLYTNPTGEVIGTMGGVLFVDVSNLIDIPAWYTHYENIHTHYLTDGDSIDLTTGVINFSSWKAPLKGNEIYANADSSRDILSLIRSREWATFSQQLFDNRADDVSLHLSAERNPRFEVKFNRISGAGYGGYHPLRPRNFVISYRDLRVAIQEY